MTDRYNSTGIQYCSEGLFNQDKKILVFLVLFRDIFCFGGIFRPTLEFFHCKFWRMLGTPFHWAVRILSVPHLLWHGHPLKWSSPRTRDTRTYCRAFGIEAVTSCFYDCLSRLGFEHPTFCLRGELSIPLLHRRGFQWYIFIYESHLV